MKETRVIKALYAKAVADREQALMALELLTEFAVGIGDHTANDFFNDAEIALQRLVDADDKLEALNKYFYSGDSKV
jgi:hypothetical protein